MKRQEMFSFDDNLAKLLLFLKFYYDIDLPNLDFAKFEYFLDNNKKLLVCYHKLDYDAVISAFKLCKPLKKQKDTCLFSRIEFLQAMINNCLRNFYRS